jgi:urease accessory protein
VITHISVEAAPERARVHLTAGPIVPRLVGRGPRSARIALVSGGALLLAGDCVQLNIDVAEGCVLELIEIGGVVAYGGDHRSSWQVHCSVRRGGMLIWGGLPFVVSDGASVARGLVCDLDRGARLLLRETTVLGRAGELGGRFWSRTQIHADARPLLLEEWSADGQVADPATLGRNRVLDSLLWIGPTIAAPGPSADITVLELEGGGTGYRRVGTSTHEVSLDHQWSILRDHALADVS